LNLRSLLAARTLAFFGVSDTRRAVTPAVFALAFNCSIRTRLNVAGAGKQFRIAPDMLVPLFLGQIAATQVLGRLPQGSLVKSSS